ncbi:hypothetical protein IQ13_2938 [Lacibacter cauensis]|uniref:Lipocalin-like protein n=1 Tax=Lacibacter cauensis TaxID=510947 RepID=A0A562SFZ1_9BACT|nr:hypothetical protein [Lacibacter cauensis]TWI80265.1 hypothetical protein IQ13_2938 [Lacibacter cauensis]
MKPLSFIFLLLLSLQSCEKEKANENEQLLGSWLRTGATGTEPAAILIFSKNNGQYKLDFTSTGSPGPGYPATASTNYSLSKGVLSFGNYVAPASGMIIADSFKWVAKGKEFEIKLRHLLFYMSADYTVRYTKAN